MSAVLLEQESFASDSFLKQMAKSRVRGKAVSDIKPEKGGVFSFDVGDESLVFLHVEAPYPDDPEGPIATSWLWPREPHRKRQTAPLISAGHDDRRCRRTSPAAADIDPVTALAAKQSGVMAVYWADASLVIFPPLFIDMAEETNTLQSPPLYLWVDLRAFRNEDGTTGLFTAGLAALGHMEIEIPRIKMEIGELREWLVESCAICWRTVRF